MANDQAVGRSQRGPVRCRRPESVNQDFILYGIFNPIDFNPWDFFFLIKLKYFTNVVKTLA